MLDASNNNNFVADLNTCDYQYTELNSMIKKV